MFRKIVAVEDILVNARAEQELHRFAASVELYHDSPGSEEECIRRIGDADCVLVSFRTAIGRSIIARQRQRTACLTVKSTACALAPPHPPLA